MQTNPLSKYVYNPEFDACKYYQNVGGEDEGRGKIFLWDTVKGYFFSHFYKFIMLKKLVTLFKDF